MPGYREHMSSQPPESSSRDRLRLRAAFAPGDVPSNVDELVAAADGELDQEPVRRTLARVGVAATVAALVLVLFVLAATQWWKPGTLIHDVLRADCSHVFGKCDDVPIGELDTEFHGELPPGTRLVYSTRVKHFLRNVETVSFEVVLPAGSTVPSGYGPWEAEVAPNGPAEELNRRGLVAVVWLEGMAAGTNPDGSVTLRGSYSNDVVVEW